MARLFLEFLKEYEHAGIKTLLFTVIVSTLMVACSSAERRADKRRAEVNKSQVELNELKMEIVEDYQKCVDKSDTQAELAKCEVHLKAAEGL